jgi:hypothetical protein
MIYVALGVAVLLIGILGAGAVFARKRVLPMAHPVPQVTEETARDEFHIRREMLEAKFLTLAAASGKPRGLAWSDCDFEDDVSFARDRETRELQALVAVTIRFEAIEGGGMEDNPNVGNLRAATAVFRFQHGVWMTDGRAIFNLNPAEAIRYYQLETAD